MCLRAERRLQWSRDTRATSGLTVAATLGLVTSENVDNRPVTPQLDQGEPARGQVKGSV